MHRVVLSVYGLWHLANLFVQKHKLIWALHAICYQTLSTNSSQLLSMCVIHPNHSKTTSTISFQIASNILFLCIPWIIDFSPGAQYALPKLSAFTGFQSFSYCYFQQINAVLSKNLSLLLSPILSPLDTEGKKERGEASLNVLQARSLWQIWSSLK